MSALQAFFRNTDICRIDDSLGDASERLKFALPRFV